LLIGCQVKGFLATDCSRVCVLPIDLILRCLFHLNCKNVYILFNDSEIFIEDQLKVGRFIGEGRNDMSLVVIGDAEMY
jgi:hypothetical protein